MIAAAFDAEYAPEPGRPRKPATLAMPTSVPRRAARIGATNGWNVCTMPSTLVSKHRAERRQVLGVLGQRAARDAGVGDDDVGRAEARDEVGAGARQRRGVAHVARVGGDARRRAASRRARSSSALAPREQPERSRPRAA